mgnify:CR=1 FL=1
MNYSVPPIHLITNSEQRNIQKWNAWKMEYPGVIVDLIGADLSNCHLGKIDLSNVLGMSADFSGAYLAHANLSDSSFDHANFEGAKLTSSTLRSSYFPNVNFRKTDLSWSNMSSSILDGANFDSAILPGTVGACHPNISAAVPVGSGQLCSARFNRDTKTITIWGGCETFSSFVACHARIIELGGEHQKARLAWLKWVSVSLTGKKLKFWLDTANTNG